MEKEVLWLLKQGNMNERIIIPVTALATLIYVPKEFANERLVRPRKQYDSIWTI